MIKTHVIEIDGAKISGWDDFHDLFADRLGFPTWYGRNLDAWIDLMTYLEFDRETTKVVLEPGETMVFRISNWERLRDERPEIFTALVECSAIVNHRTMEAGEHPYLVIAFSQ
jgi:hypothetical protein